MTSKKIEKVVEAFKTSLNYDNEYSLKDLSKLLEDSYKTIYGKGKKKTGEKKAPSSYNIFIRDEIAKIKVENPTGVPPNEYMRIAAERWKAHKESLEVKSKLDDTKA
jgi:hypothetical protein